jgi:hypothetical protein
MKRKLFSLLYLLILILLPTYASGGLYEELQKEELYWIPPLKPPKSAPDTLYERILTPDPEATLTKIYDSRFEPYMLVRTSFSYTHTDEYDVKLEDGRTLHLNSENMDTSQFGHKFGPALENVEMGMSGRYQSSGIHYHIKFELVPREKDGNRSNDYLKDAYVGWDRFTVFKITAGRMKVPFSQVNMKSTASYDLVYAPVIDILSPKRQVGYKLTLQDPWQIISFTCGVFTSISFAQELVKNEDQLLYTYRAELNLHNIMQILNILYKDLYFRIGLNIATTKFSYDTQSEVIYSGADFKLHLLLLSIEGEYVSKNFYLPPLPDGTVKSDRGWGWHLDFITHIWPNIIDLIFRIEEFDGDSVIRGLSSNLSIDEMSRQKKRWKTIGLTSHLSNQLKIQFNYIMRDELEGYKFDNDVFIALVQFHY